MYYYVDTDGLVRLLDGDKLSSLAAMFIMDLVKAAGVEIKVGVVQTAYANGNSTSYMTKVLVPLPPLPVPDLFRKSPFYVHLPE
jgi:phosphoacetylglucosamine mutase